MTKFPAQLRALMDERQLTQAALAAAAGCAQNTVSDWLAGRREPLLSSAARLADVLGVSLDALAGRKTRRARKAS